MLSDVRETEKFAGANGMDAMYKSATLRAKRYSDSILETEKCIGELRLAIKQIEDKQLDMLAETKAPDLSKPKAR